MQIKAVDDKIVLTGLEYAANDFHTVELSLEEALRLVGSNPVGVNKNVLCISTDFAEAIRQVKENTKKDRQLQIDQLEEQIRKLKELNK